MTLPVYPSSISLNQVNTELGKSATASISLNDTNVRTLAQKTSSTISMYDLFGKSSAKSTITEIAGINVSPRNYGLGVGMNYDGTRVAVDNAAGAVLVYSRSGSTWTLIQTISNAASQFGYSVSMSHDGNTLLATAFAGGGLGIGYVYAWNGSSYVLNTTLTIPNSGYYAVLNSDGNTIVSMCPTYSPAGYTNSARAIIFKKVSGTWDSGTFIYPPVNYNSFLWWPTAVSGDGNWKFLAGSGTTPDMGRVSVFDSSNNRYDFPNTVNATSPSIIVCDYTATNVYHTFTSVNGDTCRRYIRSGTTFTLVETITVPPGYGPATNYMRALGMSKFADYSVVGHQYYGTPQNGAFWTYNGFVQRAFKAGDQTGASFGGSYNFNGVMSGDGGVIWQLRSTSGVLSLRFFTYT